jgi:hypothetical protein
MAWRAARTFGLLTLGLAGLAAPAARAQALMEEPPPETVAEAPLPEPRPRPRFSLAVGMGATIDSTGFTDGSHLMPAFFGVGGFGDGLAGFDLGAFSSSASGRFTSAAESHDAPVDRLALDAFGVIRPAARVHRDDRRYRYRVLHTLAAELGLGLERDGRTMVSGSRWEVHTGARVEFPLTRASAPSELRLRLAVRRAFGLYTPEVAVASSSTAVTSVGDSTELYAALAVVF